MEKKCECCGDLMVRNNHYSIKQFQSRRFCSMVCKGKVMKPEALTSWRGGIRKSNGYILIYSPHHPTGKKYVQEHRLVMERYLGRIIEKAEVVHHKNGIKNDNRLENLDLITGTDHSRLHAIESGLGKDSKEYRLRNVKGQFI